ncbi:MAG: MFS transporter permease [Pseudomonadota bacterium]
MTGEWLTYRLADFVPFSAEVYFRMIERVNATEWPLHLLSLAGTLALLPMLRWGHRRSVALLLTAMWVWVGYGFLLSEYASLNWAAGPIAWVFYGQGALLAALGLSGKFALGERSHPAPVPWVGAVLCWLGLCYPVLAFATAGGFGRGEVVGIHPDPTAVATLGVCLLALRGWALWVSMIVPLSWCLFSGLTLWVLGAVWALPLMACAGVALAAALAAGCFKPWCARRHS